MKGLTLSAKEQSRLQVLNAVIAVNGVWLKRHRSMELVCGTVGD
mgnify:CR=1 FL=1